jgi:hypothetical protein
MDLQSKIAVLKKYELLRYQVAYYLLEKEKDAVEATLSSLLQLSQDNDFFVSPEISQRMKAKVISMKAALAVKQRQLRKNPKDIRKEG